LSEFPTPLDELTRVTEKIGGPRLFCKRDDLTTFALGGNKVRKLEFALGDAQRLGADVIVTGGAGQSNHSRVSAAAATMIGMECQLILGGEKNIQGNVLLDTLLGAEIFFMGNDVTTDEINLEIRVRADRLRLAGRNPYEMPVVGGAETRLGVIGYLAAYFELSDQLDRIGVSPTHIYICAGSAASQAGLLLGARIMGHRTRVIGISIRRTAEELQSWISKYIRDTLEMLDVSVKIDTRDIEVNDSYVGPGYGIITPEVREAILLLARTSGILIDHVYAGKALTGVFDLIHKGTLTNRDTVIFVHTGGVPSIFSTSDQLIAHDAGKNRSS